MFRKAASPSAIPAGTSTVTETAPCEKSVKVRVKPDAIAPVRAAVLAEFQREAALPGFRKGKAPADMVERQHAKSIQEETLHRLARQALERATDEHQLKPVGPYEIRKADFTDAEGLTLEAIVEVEPAFALGAYSKIPLTRPSAEVGAEELDKALANVQESMAQMVPSGQGEEKTKQVPKLDDDLAKDLGLESLAKLREHVEAKLKEQKRASQAQALESGLFEELLKRHAFQVPARLVQHQTERLTREFTTRMLLSGTPEDKAKEETAKFTEQLRTSAERHVKLGFILDRIAEKESVAVAQDEVVARLWRVAQRWKKDPAEVRKIFDEQGLWPSVISSIRHEKITAWLLNAAAITNGAGASPAAAKPVSSSTTAAPQGGASS